MRKLALPFGLLALLHLTTAHAYIGPGLGAGTIAIVLGVLSSIVLAFLGILWYPFKRLLRLIRGKKAPTRTSVESNRDTKDPGAGSSSARDSAERGRAPPTPGGDL